MKPLTVILLVSLLLRTYVALSMPVGNDEGNYILDAHYLSEGLTAFKDFLTRDVFYITTLQLVEGQKSLIAGRMVSVIAATLTIVVVYFLTKKLADKKAALIAAAIFAFTPFSVMQMYPLANYPLQILLSSLSILALVYSFFTISGLFLGLAITARLSTLVLLPLILLYAYYTRKTRNLVFFVIGTLLALAPSYLLYGPNMFTSIQGTASISLESAIQAIYLLFGRFPDFALLLTLIPLAVISRFKSERRYQILMLILLVGGFSSMLLDIYGLGVEFPLIAHVFRASIVLLNLTIALSLLTVDLADSKIELIPNSKNLLLVLWAVSVAGFYILFGKWHTYYFTEMLPSLSVLSGIILSKAKLQWFTAGWLILILVGGYGLSATYSSHNPTMEAINNVSAYVEKNCVDTEIFTARTDVAYLSNKDPIMHITHPVYYSYAEQSSIAYSSVKYMPTISQIIEHLNTTNIDCAVIDPYTELCYFNINPELKQYFDDHYQLDTQIEQFKLYRRTK